MDPTLLFWSALIVMLIGLFGSLAPGIPGVPLVWLALAVYGALDGFHHLTLLRFAVLTVLCIISASAEFWGSQLLARAGGASGWSAFAGTCLAVLGLIFLTLPMALLLALAGVFGLEWRRRADAKRAALSSAGWLIGWLVSTVVEFGTALAVILLFIQAAVS